MRMPSPDRFSSSPSEPPLPPEKKDSIRRRILADMCKIIESYEALYTPSDEVRALQGTSLTKSRYAKFEAWLETLSQTGSLPPNASHLDQSLLAEHASHVVALYQALHTLAIDRPLPSDIRKRYEARPLAPDEFLLAPEDIPAFTELPSEAEIKTNFAFDWIWASEYKEGRKLNDPNDAALTTKETLKDRKGFVPADQDLLNVKYGIDDQGVDHPEKRQAFLKSVDLDRLPETLPPAKIFEIGDVIAKKKAEAEARGETHEDLSLNERALGSL